LPVALISVQPVALPRLYCISLVFLRIRTRTARRVRARRDIVYDPAMIRAGWKRRWRRGFDRRHSRCGDGV